MRGRVDCSYALLVQRRACSPRDPETRASSRPESQFSPREARVERETLEEARGASGERGACLMSPAGHFPLYFNKIPAPSTEAVSSSLCLGSAGVRGSEFGMPEMDSLLLCPHWVTLAGVAIGFLNSSGLSFHNSRRS